MLNRLKTNKDKLKKEVIEMEKVELEIAEENVEKPGTFTGLVLLNSTVYDFEQLYQDLIEDWDLSLNMINDSFQDESIVFEHNGMILSLSLVTSPVPNDEAVKSAHTNFYWSEAVEVTKQHKAHIVLAVLNGENNLMEAGILFVKLVASTLNQDNATGIFTLETVFRGGFYRENAIQTINVEKRFPLLNLVFLVLYTTDGQSVSAYTFGLEQLGRKEIEIVESKNSMEDVHMIIYNTVSYIIEQDIMLHTGETIGVDETQKLEIVESLGFALDPNKTTLKINY